MNNTQKDFKLLPTYFKKIAFALIGISAIFWILSTTKLIPIERELTELFTKNIILISLLILTISSNKIEDELTHKIRLKAFAFAFISGVALTVFGSITSAFFSFQSSLVNMSPTSLLIQMFMFYYVFMFAVKKGNREK